METGAQARGSAGWARGRALGDGVPGRWGCGSGDGAFEGRSEAKGAQLRACVAICADFVFPGLWHADLSPVAVDAVRPAALALISGGPLLPQARQIVGDCG